jgi:hypothetical protein
MSFGRSEELLTNEAPIIPAERTQRVGAVLSCSVSRKVGLNRLATPVGTNAAIRLTLRHGAVWVSFATANLMYLH